VDGMRSGQRKVDGGRLASRRGRRRCLTGSDGGRKREVVEEGRNIISCLKK